jgi:hypothetical protein
MTQSQRSFSLLICVFLLLPGPLPGAPPELVGRIIDENGVPVAGARLMLISADSQPIGVTSDEAGRFLVPDLIPGHYRLRVEKVGYYAFVAADLTVGELNGAMEVILNHRQEFEETVNVEYSAPAVDRNEVELQSAITAEQIIDLPYSATHDFRNALPMIPGVFKDTLGRIHMNGGADSQSYYSLDGFNITSPVSSSLENSVSVDAIRAVKVETSRYSAEYGKGSAGVLSLETSRGDDRFRFSATNFLPSYEFHKGLVLSNWSPRFMLSGPIARGRAWFSNALDAQYERNIIDALPANANTNTNWFGSDLTRVQVNLTSKNLLTAGLLFNFQSSRHFGISPLDPMETSRNRYERFYFFNVKDEAYLSGGWVIETGVALNRMRTRERPIGFEPYVISPSGRSGNYFLNSDGQVQRFQALANLLAPSFRWHGRHSMKFGMDANRIRYRQMNNRHALEIRRESGTLARAVHYEGSPRFGRDSSEFSGFVQDRWNLTNQLRLEAGMRFDWDQIVRQPITSPRVALTWGPASRPETKFSAGVGLFYDATNLSLLTRSLDQHRFDTFYAADGVTPLSAPIQSRFTAQDSDLRAPAYLNWSLGWEQKVTRGFYLRSNLVRKQGWNGWAYNWNPPPEASPTPWTLYRLDSSRRDRYWYLELTVSRTFWNKYPWLLSYARSRTRSSAVIDFSLENPIFAHQGGGPMDWDIPNRLISWGTLPAPFRNKYMFAYFAEWHSGFPYSIVNETQQLLGSPNSRRFPDYFSANLHLERRFRLWRKEWALRAGFNNITSHTNPMVVNNNIDSPQFGEFSGGQGRVFTGRIRLLGKN